MTGSLVNTSCSVQDDVKWRLYREQSFAGGDEPSTYPHGKEHFPARSWDLARGPRSWGRGNPGPLSLGGQETSLLCADQERRGQWKDNAWVLSLGMSAYGALWPPRSPGVGVPLHLNSTLNGKSDTGKASLNQGQNTPLESHLIFKVCKRGPLLQKHLTFQNVISQVQLFFHWNIRTREC